MIKTETGDATSPRPNGKGVIIAHICNTLGMWGAGFVKAVDKISRSPQSAYSGLAYDHGSREQHGRYVTRANIPIGTLQFVEALPNLWVANMVVQKGTNSFDSTGNHRRDQVNITSLGPFEDLVDYAALEKCLAEVFHRAVVLECVVSIPAGMGSGLAGGDKTKIHQIIREAYEGEVDTLDNILDVTLWEFADPSATSFVPPTTSVPAT